MKNCLYVCIVPINRNMHFPIISFNRAIYSEQPVHASPNSFIISKYQAAQNEG